MFDARHAPTSKSVIGTSLSNFTFVKAHWCDGTCRRSSSKNYYPRIHLSELLKESHNHLAEHPFIGSTNDRNRAHIDVGLVPKTFGHYVENTGNDDLIFLEMFKGDRFMDLSLSDCHTPPELITQHLGVGEDVLRIIPKDKAVVMPI